MKKICEIQLLAIEDDGDVDLNIELSFDGHLGHLAAILHHLFMELGLTPGNAYGVCSVAIDRMRQEEEAEE